jgi:uncharacterized protein YbgA (DUF1722 family)
LGDLVKLHTQHKILLLAHSRKHFEELGRLVAKPNTLSLEKLKDKYGGIFMEAFTFKVTPKKIPMYYYI